ncbi:MAG: RHS repeat-associated core domain-containing protein [Capsulimonadaceae bacterium]|nr:RHS repeat-associated core domain-containing protein [Capsulimonadaceae bacterium]
MFGESPTFEERSASAAASAALYGQQYGNQADAAASDTNRLYVRARHYDTLTGRWMSRDPLGDVDGPNVYAYCGNDGVPARGHCEKPSVPVGICAACYIFGIWLCHCGNSAHASGLP